MIDTIGFGDRLNEKLAERHSSPLSAEVVALFNNPTLATPEALASQQVELIRALSSQSAQFEAITTICPPRGFKKDA